MTSLIDDLDGLVADRFDYMVDVRRALHATPELSFEEVATTRLIREQLRGWGWSEAPCPTDTGAVFTLEASGRRPSSGSGDGERAGAGSQQGDDPPTVMLRADIDALPVDEAVELPFSSEHPGMMHACGHDAHVAALLGVCQVLAARSDQLIGRVVAVFQPAEEVISGAKAMVAGGLLDQHRPDVVLGAHVTSRLPVGYVVTRPGALMAAGRIMRAVITGAGGHGALNPLEGNVVLAAARLASRMDEAVLAMDHEGAQCVCTAGVVHAGTAANVVPTRAEVQGTIRTFTDEQTERAWGRLRELGDEIAAALDVSIDWETRALTPAVRNDPEVAGAVLALARRQVGDAMALEMPWPVMASDDVSELLRRVPGCYWFVGAGLADGTSGMHHSPTFAIDEECLRVGARVMAGAAAGWLSSDGA